MKRQKRLADSLLRQIVGGAYAPPVRWGCPIHGTYCAARTMKGQSPEIRADRFEIRIQKGKPEKN